MTWCVEDGVRPTGAIHLPISSASGVAGSVGPLVFSSTAASIAALTPPHPVWPAFAENGNEI